MIRTVVLPNAMDGIVTGCILAIGRITGESAALLFTAGFGLKMVDFFQSLQSSSATLTVALYIYASERGAYDVAFAIAVILIILTFLLNMLLELTCWIWSNALLMASSKPPTTLETPKTISKVTDVSSADAHQGPPSGRPL